ncbi:MAG TPA: 16S rRNA (guanine(527)-N(7))-methyltransferase RsmG [Actinomycetota bacterium]|nr:16S rRNA (guanine(527)-N(7))-methyltransferase RsmG [Actinomycetota bacterium]
MKRRDLVAEAASTLGLALTDAQVGALLGFADRLAGRGIEIGAVARGDRDRILERHVLDSLRATPFVRPEDRIAYDFGSGGGLPGVPLAVACPWTTWVLVESRHWRAAFLELVADELGLNVRVERSRVEDMAVPADLATSRAFAPLGRAWELARPRLKPGGRLVFFAGARMTDPEADLSGRGVHGSVDVIPDVLDRGGALVIIERP